MPTYNEVKTLAHYWLVEEMGEYLTAHTTNQELDACWDILGVLILKLLLESEFTRKRSFAAYAEAQTKRGRKPEFWTPVLNLIANAKVTPKMQRHLRSILVARHTKRSLLPWEHRRSRVVKMGF